MPSIKTRPRHYLQPDERRSRALLSSHADETSLEAYRDVSAKVGSILVRHRFSDKDQRAFLSTTHRIAAVVDAFDQASLAACVLHSLVANPALRPMALPLARRLADMLIHFQSISDPDRMDFLLRVLKYVSAGPFMSAQILSPAFLTSLYELADHIIDNSIYEPGHSSQPDTLSRILEELGPGMRSLQDLLYCMEGSSQDARHVLALVESLIEHARRDSRFNLRDIR